MSGLRRLPVGQGTGGRPDDPNRLAAGGGLGRAIHCAGPPGRGSGTEYIGPAWPSAGRGPGYLRTPQPGLLVSVPGPRPGQCAAVPRAAADDWPCAARSSDALPPGPPLADTRPGSRPRRPLTRRPALKTRRPALKTRERAPSPRGARDGSHDPRGPRTAKARWAEGPGVGSRAPFQPRPHSWRASPAGSVGPATAA